MGRKPKMTVTSRFLDEQPPLAARCVPSPFPNPPPHRSPIGRLWFSGPSAKLGCSAADLVHAIGVAALPDAVVFLDTNIFTTEIDASVWDALCTKQMFIVPGVWAELMPWLKTPFRNAAVRDRVVGAIRSQVRSAGSSLELSDPHAVPSDNSNIEVLFLDEELTNHGYEYYFKLLALRKAMGPLAAAVLAKRLGREPTNDEFLAEVQGRLGPRGLRLAKKGLEAANSPNMLNDEHLVVMAILTAILRGRETFIVTRDADVFEQYFKVLCLVKEHYRAMHVAERYAANPEAMAFRELPIHNDGGHIPEFCGTSFLELETTDAEFNPLPARFNCVNIYCLLLGGETTNMRITTSCFCAEKEMAQMMMVKVRTQGLNTDKLNGRNCTICTERLTPENHKVVVSIGKETMVPFANLGMFGLSDLNNALSENEMHTRYTYDDLRAAASRPGEAK
jgi:hypothetical protein